MQVPLLDLRVQYQSIEEEIKKAIQNVLNNCNFIMGEDVKKLEEEIASYCGTKFAVGVASGTDALVLSLIACGIQDGDGVITTPFTFIATTEAISKVRGQIIFVDIDPKTYNIDPQKIKAYIEQNCVFDDKTRQLVNSQTRKPIKVILPVHLYGHPVDMDPIMELAKKYNLIVIEDCAQAIGAEYRSTRAQEHKSTGHQLSRHCEDPERSEGDEAISRKVGSVGDAGCLSFFPSKNLGCYGDGGMVVTNDAKLAEQVAMLRVHGCKTKYYHLIDGFNSRLDTLQAAVLRVKLKYIDQWNDARLQKARTYNELFSSTLHPTPDNPHPIVPYEANYAKHVFYAYTIRTKNRDALQEHLKSKGISTAIYYPVPLHLQDVYKHLGYKRGYFPISEQYSDEVLSLPIYPEITEEQQRCIVGNIEEFYKFNADLSEFKK